MNDLAYIECDGVRVPSDWTTEQLREALAKRKIRFIKFHEREIEKVFGEAIRMKKKLEEQINSLRDEMFKLQDQVRVAQISIKKKENKEEDMKDVNTAGEKPSNPDSRQD